VSDQLPTISGKQLIRVLERKGWYVKRIRGSHHVLRHPEIAGCITRAGASQSAAQARHTARHPEDCGTQSRGAAATDEVISGE